MSVPYHTVLYRVNTEPNHQKHIVIYRRMPIVYGPCRFLAIVDNLYKVDLFKKKKKDAGKK